MSKRNFYFETEGVYNLTPRTAGSFWKSRES